MSELEAIQKLYRAVSRLEKRLDEMDKKEAPLYVNDKMAMEVTGLDEQGLRQLRRLNPGICAGKGRYDLGKIKLLKAS